MVSYISYRWPELLVLTWEHALVVVVSVALASVLGVGVACLVYHRPHVYEAAVNATNVLFVVPALAYFGFLIYITGFGFVTPMLVLTLYALLPILRNTVTGLREVDPAIVKSAAGMGMGRTGRLLRIELPLAWPVILSGIRVSTVIICGIAAIASYVNGPGLGSEIFSGLSRIGTPLATAQALVGTLGVILVALILDALLALAGRITTPKGMR